jgi:ABC-type multidrug transport system fused ATPase/permease subunit
MFLQILDTAREGDILTRFRRAAWDTVSCALIAVLAWAVLLGQFPKYPDDVILGVMTGVQMLAAVVLAVALVSIERRPDVYLPDGTLVERQFKASLFARYTLSWSVDILDLAATKPINVEEMPAPDSRLRSEEAKNRFRAIVLKPTVKLWKLIFWAFQNKLYWQWFLIFVSCFFDVAPQFTMLKLLQFLENRRDFNPLDPQAWFWVGMMFVITVGSTMIDYRIFWLMMCEVAVPVRSVLTALIFEKMMKMKDTKEPPSRKEDSKDPSADTDAKDSNTKTKGETEKKPKTQQDIVNMFTVDTNLVGLFTGNQQFYLNFLTRLVLAIVFLWLLVGWVSMIAGMSVMVIMYPMNHYLGKRYASLQKDLMKARDTKTTVITEALHGIRQIKFSAIESQWAKKIEDIRAVELEKIWQTKVNNVIMGLVSDLSPVLFAALALATYSYIHGNLLPSIAFTALSLFMQLEGLMHMIPLLLAMGVNAKVSADRIDAFLQAPEKTENTYPGDSISFSNASVTFPSDSPKDDEDRFILRDITLDFPNGALSVISGPTGSGKSLLLAAILGEADVLSGDIRVPRSPPVTERFDSKATAANWIIPTAIAYVSQTPWIENATIKNNILFGLPDDPVRYAKVIKACALTKDLAMFEDGDSTEVGAQGISLSGGQKWRLTLARAFYSGAGILILDDVFSALDAHVGKEIYENALMGELSEGRTRILVTHHVSLCLPRAKYAVRLGAHGTLEHAGLTEHLRETGSLVDILKAEAGDEDSGTIEVASTADEGQTEDAAPVAKATPKKLIEEESRETGRVKKTVYLSYLKASGGFPFWTLVVLVYLLSQTLTVSRSWWVRIWTASYEHARAEMIHITHKYSIQNQFFIPNTDSAELYTQGNNEALQKLGYYLGIYIAISLVSITVAAGRVFLVYRGSLGASRKVFRDMTYSVLRTPMRWLDTVPTGRILNRFTADFQSMDSQLSLNFAYVAGAILEIIGILIAA